MSRLTNRVKKLEEAFLAPDPCPVCHGEYVRMVALVEQRPDGTLHPDPDEVSPPVCPGCGRKPDREGGVIAVEEVIIERPPGAEDAGGQAESRAE
jgi:hypothetical protein